MHYLIVEQYTFGEVENFKYLGVKLNNKNYVHNEIRLRLNAANYWYYAMNNICFSSIWSSSKGTIYDSKSQMMFGKNIIHTALL